MDVEDVEVDVEVEVEVDDDVVLEATVGSATAVRVGVADAPLARHATLAAAMASTQRTAPTLTAGRRA